MIERGVQVYLVSHDYLFKINFFLKLVNNKHFLLFVSKLNSKNSKFYWSKVLELITVGIRGG